MKQYSVLVFLNYFTQSDYIMDNPILNKMGVLSRHYYNDNMEITPNYKFIFNLRVNKLCFDPLFQMIEFIPHDNNYKSSAVVLKMICSEKADNNLLHIIPKFNRKKAQQLVNQHYDNTKIRNLFDFFCMTSFNLMEHLKDQYLSYHKIDIDDHYKLDEPIFTTILDKTKQLCDDYKHFDAITSKDIIVKIKQEQQKILNDIGEFLKQYFP